MSAGDKKTSKSARILYKPWGIGASIIAGVAAGQIVDRIWARVTPVDTTDRPKPLESEYPLGQVIAAAALQGAVYAVVKAAVQRATARGFEHWTGEWPGD